MNNNRFKADKALEHLKDFQRNTVEYIFDQLYRYDKTDRFLLSDEVGLGKTMVARGVIAKAIEHCQDTIDRFDVVYICSNAAIARQNIRKLNVLDNQAVRNVDRLTLLPVEVKKLNEAKKDLYSNVNFISFSPQTSLDLGCSDGRYDERILIYHMLKSLPDINRNGFKNLLRRRVGYGNWGGMIKNGEELECDKKLVKDYIDVVQADHGLLDALKECSNMFSYNREKWPDKYNRKANEVVGKLRQKLAAVCVDALEPDIIILDEFQRFKSILNGDSEAAMLAKSMFEYSDENSKVKLLLLSATPYKMMTLNTEDENHYLDFLDTLSFLYKHDDQKIQSLKESLRQYRYALNDPETFDSRLTLELREKLMQVMCRTERVNITKDHNAMLREYKQIVGVEANDLRHATYFGDVAEAVQSHNVIEYWKSSPYLLNYLKGYHLRDRVDKLIETDSHLMLGIIDQAEDRMISQEKIERYAKIEPANPRLRYLMDETVGKGMWKLLWMPPSMPYYANSGVFENTEKLSKNIIFSSWNAVPDAVSTLLSYEAERLMVKSYRDKEGLEYSNLSDLSTLLEFRIVDDRPVNMPIFAWMMPCEWLANEIDPLLIAMEADGDLTQQQMLAIIEEKIRDRVGLISSETETGQEDVQWYSKATAMFEEHSVVTSMHEWVKWQDKTSSGLRKHIDAYYEIACNETIGKIPDDLTSVLAYIALAGPGTCALRAIKRTVRGIDPKTAYIIAAEVGNGFRTLFNKPENTMLVRSMTDQDDYWRQVLQYSVDGNMQSLIDEQFHLYAEELRANENPDKSAVIEVFTPFIEALTLKTSRVQLDEFIPEQDGVKVNRFNIRCNFALRYGKLKSDQGESLARAQDVQSAFNSPFRPFVLISTSLGQEGLDFHPWCHSVVHWNLPSNPVDLEQREGRVQRYKGLAVRKNIVQKYGLQYARKRGLNSKEDIWEWLFDTALELKSDGSNDLIPYWIFEDGDAHIRRIVPMLPYSKEVGRFVQLKDMLTLYRLAFGQPRQQDLLAYLSINMDDEVRSKIIDMQLVLMPQKKITYS